MAQRLRSRQGLLTAACGGGRKWKSIFRRRRSAKRKRGSPIKMTLATLSSRSPNIGADWRRSQQTKRRPGTGQVALSALALSKNWVLHTDAVSGTHHALDFLG